MSNFELYINEAMDRDIRTLRQAQENLNQAAASIDKLVQLAGGMQGKTAQAIADKANELKSKINKMTEQNLPGAISAIQRAKAEYQEKERQIGSKISGM